MKSFLITLLMLTSSFASLRGQWEVINEGHPFYIVDFVNKDVGWMATYDAILKTVDGGKTWIPDAWNLGEDFHGCDYGDVFDFVNDTTGWLVMDCPTLDRCLYLTVDGGKSWERSLEGKSLELEFVSEDMVIVSTEDDDHYHLLKSKDGGVTWADISPVEDFGEPLTMSFIGSDTGIYTTRLGSFYKFNRTFDGGSTWHHGTFAEFRDITDIGYIDNFAGYFVTREGYSNYVLYKTEDAFDTWTVVTENKYPISSCHFFNKDVCIAIMGDSMGCNILKSYDGGKSWIDTASYRLPYCEKDHSCSYIDISPGKDSTVFIYSRYWIPASVILKSTDQGG